jgi:hypothetical protein
MFCALMAVSALMCCICETASVVIAPRSALLSAALVWVLAVSGCSDQNPEVAPPAEDSVPASASSCAVPIGISSPSVSLAVPVEPVVGLV